MSLLDFYYYKSPNGRKVLIALEELALPYRIHWVDLSKGEQHDPDYLKLSPGGKIPALVDPDGPVRLFESAAILIYLADKSGGLLAPAGEARYSDGHPAGRAATGPWVPPYCRRWTSVTSIGSPRATAP